MDTKALDFLNLKEVVSKLTPVGLHRLQWSERVFCTTNFFKTVKPSKGLGQGSTSYTEGELNQFLRFVDVVLTFNDNMHLLLSEREADRLLSILWGHLANGTVPVNCPRFTNFSYVRTALGQHETIKLQLPPPRQGDAKDIMGLDAFVSIQLFNGETMFGTDEMQRELRSSVATGKSSADQLARMRGLTFTLDQSDLQYICELVVVLESRGADGLDPDAEPQLE